MINRYILILLCVIFLPQNSKVYARENSRRNKLANYLQYQPQRMKGLRFNEFMEVLNIRPGMTILDIGTGTGQYAYKFAEKLNGTGKVFATDIDADLINYVMKEADRRGLNNLYPALVKEDGVDEFYAQHKYDLILNFHVFTSIDNPVSYFKKMRELLNKNGRLVITNAKCFPRFTMDDFSDIDGLIKELSLEPVTSPFYKGLRKSTRKLLQQELVGKPDVFLNKAVVDDLNYMQNDRYFCHEFLDDKRKFKKEVPFSSEEEKNFVNLSLLRLDRISANKTFYKHNMRINKLLIVQRFKEYLKKNARMLPYEAQGQCDRNLKTKKILKEAGYKLENEYYFFPYEYSLVFIVQKDLQGK